MEVQTKYGWQLYWTPVFEELYLKLIVDVERAAEKHPDSFHKKPDYKLLDQIDSHIKNQIPQDPNHHNYGLGTTLGDGRKEWRRAKKQLPSRFRLFFQFNTVSVKYIVYAYFNDRNENIIRREGDKKDIYVHFSKLLNNGKIPNSWSALLVSCNPTELDLEGDEQEGA